MARALDAYFPTILKNSLGELIAAGFLSDNIELEVYDRLHEVVTASLDKAIALDRKFRKNSIKTSKVLDESTQDVEETTSLSTNSQNVRHNAR